MLFDTTIWIARSFLKDTLPSPFDATILPVSYTHLRAHETVLDLVCRLLLEKKQSHPYTPHTLAVYQDHSNGCYTLLYLQSHLTDYDTEND